MKKNKGFRVGILLFLLLFFCFSLPVSAADEAEEEYWGDFRDALPPLVADELPATPDPAELGELVGAKHLLSVLLDGFREGGALTLPYLSSMLGLVILSAVAELLLPDGVSPSVKRLSSAAVTVCFALSISALAFSGMERALGFLEDLSGITGGILPILAGITVASGGAGTAAAGTAGGTAILSVVGSLAAGLLPSVASVCFAFSLVGSLSSELKIDGIPKYLKSLYLTLVGIFGMLSTAALAMQTSLAAAADSVAMRTAKYAVSSMIPIVGGTLASSLGTVSASLGLLRRAVGTGGVAAILLLALPTLAELLLTRFSFSLCASAAHLLHAERAEKMLTEFRSVWDMMLAVSAFSAAMLILALAILAKTAIPV